MQQGEVVVGSGPTPIWDNLGGAMRSGSVIATGLSALGDIESAIITHTADQTGKLTVGLTCLDPSVTPSRYVELCKKLKTGLKAAGHSVRTVPSMEGIVLNAAQVLYNKLSSKNFEFVLWRTPDGWSVGRTTWVQNIDDYTLRDRKRPVRDAHIGMLPPKLAQIMVNLAQADPQELIYDPFCGTGVVLMEAAHMGYQVAGSDLNPAMVSATEQNMSWYQTINPAVSDLRLQESTIQDAGKLRLPNQSTTIVCEGYLGRVDLKNSPNLQRSIQNEVETLDNFYLAVLKHWRSLAQISTIVIALPFWTIEGRRIRLGVLDEVSRLGYTQMQFVGSATTDLKELTYHRPDQIVGRMIVRLTK